MISFKEYANEVQDERVRVESMPHSLSVSCIEHRMIQRRLFHFQRISISLKLNHDFTNS